MHMSVTYASQHNATAQIAEVLAPERRQPDDERSTSTVDVRAVENVEKVEDHDTRILGSAIYNGRPGMLAAQVRSSPRRHDGVPESDVT